MSMNNRLNTNPLRDPQVWILWFVSSTLGFSMGFFGPLLAEVVHKLGYGETGLGAASTVYYGGLALASTFGSWWVRRWGARSATAVGLLAAAVMNAAVPYCTSIAPVIAVRAVAGLGTGLMMIAAQAALVARGGTEHRARVTGVYAIASTIGVFMGPLVAPPLFGRSPILAFAVGAGLLAFSGIVITVAGRDVDGAVEPRRVAVAARLGIPLHATFACGFAESALLTLYPLFLISEGFDLGAVGKACSAFVWGGAISTFPISALADRIGRARVLVLCTIAGSFGTAFLSTATDLSYIVALSVCVGAAFAPLFALAMALMGDLLEPEEFPSGSAAFTSAWGIGCVAGPFLTTLSMAVLGARAIFVPTIAVFVSLAVRAWAFRPAQTPILPQPTAPLVQTGDGQ
jgi:MFS family permease